jgi:hypothetical protein
MPITTHITCGGSMWEQGDDFNECDGFISASRYDQLGRETYRCNIIREADIDGDGMNDSNA